MRRRTFSYDPIIDFEMTSPAEGAINVSRPQLVDPVRSCDLDDLISAIRTNLAPVEIDPVHHFADGLYAREITIPAGTLIVGKRHRTRHLNIVSRGRISVWSANEGITHITAPFAFTAEAGSQRVGYAHEDSVWTTIHATDETDLEVLEHQLVEPYVEPIDIAAIAELKELK